MTTRRDVFFEAEEYDRRLRAVQSAMSAQGLELLLTCSPGNLCYLTGFVSVNVLDLMFLAVPAQGSPLFYLWQFERGRAESTVVSGETFYWNTGTDPISFVVAELASRNLKGGRVGVDTGSTYTSYDIIRRLLDALDARPVKGIVEKVRLVKSSAEQHYIRKAAAITDAGSRAAIATVRDGASDHEICRAACDAMLEADTEFLCIEPMIAVGWRAGSPHSPRGGTRAGAGDAVFIELSGVRARYNAPLMRTISVGAPRPEIRELAEYSNACLDALLDAIKPGVLGSDVAAAGRAALAPIRERISFHDLYAYPVGIGFPPTWIENPDFYLSADNHEPLVAGMVFHLPLTLRVLGQFGAGFSEALIVTDDGAEPLSKIPRTLDAR